MESYSTAYAVGYAWRISEALIGKGVRCLLPTNWSVAAGCVSVPDAVALACKVVVPDVEPEKRTCSFRATRQCSAKRSKRLLTARVSINVLLMGISSPPAPPEFAAALARHLKENTLLTYDVILAIDKVDEEFWKRNDARLAFYQDHGVADRVKLWIVKSSRSLGFDVIVVDSKHFHTAFSPIDPAENKREMALF